MTFSPTWVVIPAFNEGPVIAHTLTSTIKRIPNVVVVDDCSTDDSGSIALSCGAVVCRHPVNLGQGAALATGIAYALRAGAGAIVTFDADGQHDPDDAVAMVDRLKAGDIDVVLGSRFKGATVGMSLRKRWLLKAAIVFTRITSGVRVTDTHNGLRVLSRKAASMITIRHNRMAHASEILNEISAHRLAYEEMPCTIRYTDYSVAKGQKLSGAITILSDLFVGSLHK